MPVLTRMLISEKFPGLSRGVGFYLDERCALNANGCAKTAAGCSLQPFRIAAWLTSAWLSRRADRQGRTAPLQVQGKVLCRSKPELTRPDCNMPKHNQLPTYFAYRLLAIAVSVVPLMMARPSGNKVIS
jgi:hypothetical protein